VIEAGEVGNIIKKEKSRFASILMVAMGNTSVAVDKEKLNMSIYMKSRGLSNSGLNTLSRWACPVLSFDAVK